ncbi:MAG: hypothetical protein ACM357_00480, partial [Gemmatimonadota bacterium]
MGSKARDSIRKAAITAPSEGRTPTRGRLMVIGGHEQKEAESIILQEVAKQANGGQLLVCTVASDEPEDVWKDYRKAFARLGVRRVAHLDIDGREDLLTGPPDGLLDEVRVVFFTPLDVERADGRRRDRFCGCGRFGRRRRRSRASEQVIASGESSNQQHDDGRGDDLPGESSLVLVCRQPVE